MPLDAIMVSALKNELAPLTVGAKIDKVQQPAKDMLIVLLHGAGESRRLLISAGTGTARAHFTTESYENPQQPPMFCMLLRKHLVGARISALEQPDMERILIFKLDAYDELGVAAPKQLVLELMGRNSNVILVGEQGHIIDCLRRVDCDMSRARQVLPGLIYRLPPKQDKPSFFELSQQQRLLLWQQAPSDSTTDKWLLNSFSGLSPLVCRELSHRACGEVSKPVYELSQEQNEAFSGQLDALEQLVTKGEFTPTMLSRDERGMDFSFMPIGQYENSVSSQTYPDFSTMLEAYFTHRDKQEQMHRKAQALEKSVKSAHERSLRKLGLRRQELLKTGERELNRKRGDLITANLFRMKKGESSLEAEDYYEQGCPMLLIPLDPLKTPQQNAAAYYREYNKAKTAEKYLGELIEKGEKEADYLASVLDEIRRCESDRELGQIRRELIETGFIRAQKGAKREKIKQTSPLSFRSSEGFEILVGRNNAQNDELTTKRARRNDLWLHAQKIHGSHVIICCNDEAPPEKTIYEAAVLAACHCQARDGTKVPVDFTQVRYVKKPSGALPGAVIYTDYQTILVDPDEKLAQSLQIK